MGKVLTQDAQRFMVDCLKAVGAGKKPALQQAELLIEADKMGHHSHGMNRLELYVNDIKTGKCQPNNECKILKESEATAWVDACNVLGATSSHFCMDLAIKKAGKAGVGWVSSKGGNHNGIMGFWARKAAKEGMIGMAFTNTSPLCPPTRGKQPVLGTNPLSVVAPGAQDELFYLDMATTAVAFGKIEIQRRKGKPLHPGWAQGTDGKITVDPEEASKARILLPLGGGEMTSGYKGFGLAAVVELFCGVLAGSKYGHHVRTWSLAEGGEPANLGQCFVAVNTSCFAPGFQDRVAAIMQHWRSIEPTEPCLRVKCPGDRERRNKEEAESKGTVTYLDSQIKSSAALAKKLNVTPMQVTAE
ncbi:hypothetical protein PYW08_005797 [Mythimna loreyi]|uniref:Uncharacterized protein n=1 Tax=Mythimna loreyi TaxID=667449 RepID=A0ACC2QMR0_9NEOP|nr:hypothetical protein PYW08_005797 [Mythimna loreyi]